MNGMLFPEYNFAENSDKNNIVPEYIKKQLIGINKIVLKQVENLLKISTDVVHKTAEKIMEFSSITSDDIDEIFKETNNNKLIGSYDIASIYKEINSCNQ